MTKDLEKTQVNRKRMSMEDTQPSVRVRAEQEETEPDGTKMKRPFLALFGIVMIAMVGVIGLSGLLGHVQGKTDFDRQATATNFSYLENQLEMALDDIENEDYSIALQRLNYVYDADPVQFTLAADLIDQVNAILNVTSTPVQPTLTPTMTISPTPDLRPAEEQFSNAQEMMANENWDQALAICLNLRKNHPNFRVTEIDDMVYVALRMQGVRRIVNEGKFESGIYDFALAEQYGVLDFYAVNLRSWANFYLMGNSFWLAYPEVAAGYYGQVAAAMPHLTDETGSTAFYRYWMSLIHIAQQTVDDGDVCEGAKAYGDALAASNSAQYAPTATAVWEECVALTPTATPTPTLTLTATITPTIDLTSSVTATWTPSTPTATVNVTPTFTATMAGPTNTPTTAPVDTNTPTPVPVPSDTPIPAPSNTPVPAPSNTPVPVPSDTPVPVPSDTPVSVTTFTLPAVAVKQGYTMAFLPMGDWLDLKKGGM